MVRQIFTWVGQERLSLAEVRRRLHEGGVPTRTGKAWWDRAALAYWLRNPAYQGQAAFGKTRVGERRPQLRPRRGAAAQPRRPYSVYRDGTQPIAIAVPALVSAALFAAVAEPLAANRQRHRRGVGGPRHLLQGLLVCGRCGYAWGGQPHYAVSARGQEYRYNYYRCSGRMRRVEVAGAPRCPSKPLRGPELEEAVWQDVCQLLRDPSRIEAE